MNNKKYFLLLALATVACLAFFSACSDGSDSGSGSGSGSGSAVGTWVTEFEGEAFVLHMNSDGTFELEDRISGTYEVSGSRITLTCEYDDNTIEHDAIVKVVFTLSDNTLKGVSGYRKDGTESPYPITFTRQ